MASIQSPILPLQTAATNQQRRFLQCLHYLAPASVLAYFFIASAISACTLQNRRACGIGPRKVVVPLVSLIVISFLVEASMLLTDTNAYGARYSSTDGNIYALFSLLVWSNLTISLAKSTKPAVWYPYCGSWFIGLIAEAILFAFGLTYDVPASAIRYAQITIQACRMLILILLSTILSTQMSKGNSADEESASLLGYANGDSNDTKTSNGKSSYGSITITAEGEAADLEYEAEDQRKHQERMQVVEKRLQAEGNWFTYFKAFTIFTPFLWPSKDRKLQAKLVGVCLCLLCIRALNLLEPRQLGIIVDKISTSQTHLPIFEIFLWVVYSWMDASIISQVKQVLWLPIEQYSDGALKKAAYNQIMRLSRDFHTEKRSGELYRSIDQGHSLRSIFTLLMFKVATILLDLIIAYVYLCWVFGPYLALIVAATTMIYLWTSAYLIDRQTEPRRRFVGLSRKENELKCDTIRGWHSVAYFNRGRYESDRYSELIGWNLRAQKKYYHIFYLNWAVGTTVIQLGQICACILAVYQISNGAPIGNFIMLVSYWGNFTGRLSSFAEVPRKLIQDLIDAEALLELFQKEPTVKDGKQHLNFKSGLVQLHDVTFSYDSKREVIKDLTFEAQPGQRVALVGETGGGKSTILRLLFRFYDVQNGRIMIDGQDIRDVTLSSLRENIGVVPQDPVLFNGSVMENVRYARLDATDEEVMEACKAASIHDKILTFTNGYSTRVGEGGVVLSGGELQRVAIARVILKNPRIILLDEATSAVDTETETRITQALQRLTKGRTTFTVAHRLATVKDSDIILVIKDGMIVEQGSPHELLNKKGEFAKAWLKQVEINCFPADMKPADPAYAELGNDLQTSSKSDEENRRSSDSSVSATKSLRATAPDFVPRLQGGTSTGTGQVPDQDGDQAPHIRYESGNVRKFGNKNRRNQKDKGPLAGSVPKDDAIPSESRPTTSDSKNSSQSQPDGKKGGRSNARRSKNKSEPSGSTMTNSPSEEGPIGELSQKQPRRLSAVGSDAATQASSGHGRRPPWHQRRRKAAQSETMSGEASRGAWSSDAMHQSTNPTSSDSANAADPATAKGV